MTDQELREKWLAALRSGDYRQARGDLRKRNGEHGLGHCCLGVACDLKDPEGWLHPADGDAFVSIGSHAFDDGTGRIDSELREQLGITRGQMFALARANDLGESFDQIATRIETHHYREGPPA